MRVDGRAQLGNHAWTQNRDRIGEEEAGSLPLAPRKPGRSLDDPLLAEAPTSFFSGGRGQKLVRMCVMDYSCRVVRTLLGDFVPGWMHLSSTVRIAMY